MWILLLIVQLFCLLVSAVNSAVLNCTPQSDNSCNVISIDPITKADEVISISGQSSTYIDSTITNISFADTYSLQYVPTSLFTTFPSLKSISIKNCGTATLVPEAFKNCNSLNSVVLEGGKILNVPAGIAKTCSSLITLSLVNNNIESIDANAFEGLGLLQTLQLNTNKLTCIPPTLFQNMKSLSQIVLSGNLISVIDSKVLSNLPNLAAFDISGNSLSYLPLLDLTGNSVSSAKFEFKNNPIKAINSKIIAIFTGNPTAIYEIALDGIACLPPGTISLAITSSDYNTLITTLSTCFSNYIPSMSDSAPCPLVGTTDVSTKDPKATTSIPNVVCVTYPEWKEILKNFDKSKWKKKCPKFKKDKVCLKKCKFASSGSDENSDKNNELTNLNGHTHNQNHQNHRPGNSNFHRPGNQNSKPMQQFRPGKKPIKG